MTLCLSILSLLDVSNIQSLNMWCFTTRVKMSSAWKYHIWGKAHSRNTIMRALKWKCIWFWSFVSAKYFRFEQMAAVTFWHRPWISICSPLLSHALGALLDSSWDLSWLRGFSWGTDDVCKCVAHILKQGANVSGDYLNTHSKFHYSKARDSGQESEWRVREAMFWLSLRCCIIGEEWICIHPPFNTLADQK